MSDTLPPPTPIRPPDTSNDAEFAPFVSFDGRNDACPTCEDREFIRGFETGMLMARLEAKPAEWSGTYHTENRVMLERVAVAHGYAAKFSASDDSTWLYATFTKQTSVRRLSVVPREES